jgi:ketosteroid isomerase-like protein
VNNDATVWLDKFAIREVLERFMRCDDDKAIDQLVELFTEDAVFVAGDNEFVGRDAIRSLIGPKHEADPPPWTAAGEANRQPQSQHMLVNPLVEVDGDTATAESDFVVLHADESGRVSPLYAGRFRDRLRRGDDGCWRITNRGSVILAPRGS